MFDIVAVDRETGVYCPWEDSCYGILLLNMEAAMCLILAFPERTGIEETILRLNREV